MKFNTIGYLIKEGFGNTFKNKKSTMSAMLVMCISMIMFGFFFIIGENVDHIMNTIEDAQAIQVFMDVDVTSEEIEMIGEQIKQINGVDKDKLKMLSKEEGYEKFLESKGERAHLYEAYEEIVSDSYIVSFTDLNLAREVEAEIEKLDNIKEITSANELMEKLTKMTDIIRIVTLVILVGLIIGAIFIISNTIKLTVYARRKEISIMKYVGATNSFIRWPFIVEGILIGIMSSCISILLVGSSYKIIAKELLENNVIQEVGITLLSFSEMFNMLIIVYLLLGIGIGIIGSSMSMKKYLEV